MYQLLTRLLSMKMILLATSATLLASAAPALAQDAPASAFTGPRIEVFGGWDRVGARTRYDDGTTRVTDKTHKNGGTAGMLAGYDMPVGDRFIAGVYGSYALSTAKDCAFGQGVSGCVKAGRQIEGGARFGAKMGDKALVYVKGAYVNGQLRTTYADGDSYAENVHNRDGWRAGAGVEYALTPHVYTKVEYDYTRSKTYHSDELGLTDVSFRPDRNQVVAGFGVRF